MLNDNIKILHIINALNVGGAERLLLGLCRNFKKKRYSLAVCSFVSGVLSNDFRSAGIHIFSAGNSKFDILNPFRIFKMISYIKAFNPDVIHTHLFHAGIFGRLLAHSLGKPVITTEHNTTDLIERGWVHKKLHRLTIDQGDRFIAVSQAVKNMIVEHSRIFSDRIDIIPNGIDLSQFCNLNYSPRTLMVGDEVRIGTLARLSPEKGVDRLLCSFAKLKKKIPKSILHIGGDGSERVALQRLAIQLRVDKSIVWHGSITDVRLFLESLDIFVLASRNESFGLSVVEAMACGLPVVAMSVGGIPEIIISGKNGILTPADDIDLLAEKLSDLIFDHATRKNFSDEGRITAMKYGLDYVALSYETLYRRIIGENK